MRRLTITGEGCLASQYSPTRPWSRFFRGTAVRRSLARQKRSPAVAVTSSRATRSDRLTNPEADERSLELRGLRPRSYLTRSQFSSFCWVLRACAVAATWSIVFCIVITDVFRTRNQYRVNLTDFAYHGWMKCSAALDNIVPTAMALRRSQAEIKAPFQGWPIRDRASIGACRQNHRF